MSARLLRLALERIRGGSQILPVHFRIQPGVCTCDLGEWCPSERDHFPEGLGSEEATSDEQQIQSWWETWPEAAVGVLSEDRTHVRRVTAAGAHPRACAGGEVDSQLELFEDTIR